MEKYDINNSNNNKHLNNQDTNAKLEKMRKMAMDETQARDIALKLEQYLKDK